MTPQARRLRRQRADLEGLAVEVFGRTGVVVVIIALGAIPLVYGG